MPLTSAQLTILKNDILADPALAALPNTPDDAFAIAAAYNAAASPAFVVWKSSVSTGDIMANGFTWTEIDALAVGKARIWDWMSRLGAINPSKANVRQGLRDCFGNTSATYTGMLPHLKRSATRAEKLYATGTGSDATPGTLVFEGNLSYQDVQAARSAA